MERVLFWASCSYLVRTYWLILKKRLFYLVSQWRFSDGRKIIFFLYIRCGIHTWLTNISHILWQGREKTLDKKLGRPKFDLHQTRSWKIVKLGRPKGWSELRQYGMTEVPPGYELRHREDEEKKGEEEELIPLPPSSFLANHSKFALDCNAIWFVLVRDVLMNCHS